MHAMIPGAVVEGGAGGGPWRSSASVTGISDTSTAVGLGVSPMVNMLQPTSSNA